MDEYIEREAAIARIKKYAADVYGVDLDSTEQYSADEFADIFCNGLWSAIELIDDIPAADVAPVVRTRWAHLGGDEWCCPVCGFVITTEGSWDKPTKKYCEDCGAKMDGGAE